MDNINDLTKGPIIKKLILFFLPIAAGTLFQQLYNAVDALVVGKYVGTAALAAVGGSPATVSGLIIGFCTALASGAAVVISQFFGANDHKSITAAVQTSYIFCAVLGVVVGVVIIAVTPPLLRLLKTPADTFDSAVMYQRIYFAGSIFLLIFNMGSGILRAVGNSRFPLLVLIISCLLNIGLDILFVIAFHMGVAGVGWATVIAQGVSAALVTLKLVRTKESHRLCLNERLFDFKILRSMMHIGLPAGMQASMYGISNAILQVGVNTLGTVVVASWAMGGKVDGIYWSISSSFGSAVTTFAGQCFGAGNYDRVREATKKSMALFAAITVFMSGFIMLIGKPLLNIFTDDPEVISTTWYIMMYFVPVYITWSVIEVYTGVLRGTGDTVIPFIIMAAGICAFRILWVVTAFSWWTQLNILCICYPLSWVVTDIPILYYYKKKSIISRCV